MIRDGECPLCGERTNSLAADPGKWPLRFCPPNALGKTEAHHVRCVMERVYSETRESNARSVIDPETGNVGGYESKRICPDCEILTNHWVHQGKESCCKCCRLRPDRCESTDRSVPEATLEELEPPWDTLDNGISPLVRLLHDAGFRMYSSCEGGEGHHFKLPTVIVWMRGDLATTGAMVRAAMLKAGYQGFDISLVTSHQDSWSHWGGSGPPSVLVELWSLGSAPTRDTSDRTQSAEASPGGRECAVRDGENANPHRRDPALGLYRVHWKSGGESLAAIGVLPNGDRWLAPTNWVRPTEKMPWDDIERLELILCRIPEACDSNERNEGE